MTPIWTKRAQTCSKEEGLILVDVGLLQRDFPIWNEHLKSCNIPDGYAKQLYTNIMGGVKTVITVYHKKSEGLDK